MPIHGRKVHKKILESIFNYLYYYQTVYGVKHEAEHHNQAVLVLIQTAIGIITGVKVNSYL